MSIVRPELPPAVAADAEQPSGFTYDAFISYRRAQGWRVASWLSGKLERYQPSKALLAQLPPTLRERLQKPRRVFLDTRYERGNKGLLGRAHSPGTGEFSTADRDLHGRRVRAAERRLAQLG